MKYLHFEGFSYVALTIVFFAVVALILWLIREGEGGPVHEWIPSETTRPEPWADTEAMPAMKELRDAGH